MKMSVGRVSKLTGVSVRTLHYYNEIKLLNPSEISEAGYRLYDECDLEELQQIMFFRELDFSLEDIQKIVKSPDYDKKEALENQKNLLQIKEKRLKKLISLIDKTLEGEKTMSFKEFDLSEIERAKKEYAAEVKERWGDTKTYAENEQKTKEYGTKQWKLIDEKAAEIFLWFANNQDKKPNDEEALQAVKRWQEYITEKFYTCTNPILSGLADMYIGDERFKNNIDKYGNGTAQFMHDAIKEYCKKGG